jgi:hypothetical protein
MSDHLWVTHIEPDDDNGWLIEYESVFSDHPGLVHLTLLLVEELRVGMVRINRGDETLLNVLADHLENGRPGPIVAASFADAYGQILMNRIARTNLGLKAVTRDGDEDLKAVQEGAPVRPWNAINPDGNVVADFAKRRREAKRGNQS